MPVPQELTILGLYNLAAHQFRKNTEPAVLTV